MSESPREREGRILDLLAQDGAVTVSALASEFGVSEVTIRGQLAKLESRGLLKRTHGGATTTSVQNVLERQRANADEKDRIAQAAAELVCDGDRIMIEAGTTTAGLVKHLGRRRGVQIVTNSTLVFAHARHNPGLAVIMTGGTFHRPSESLVGPVALRAIKDFHVRLAFVGTDGFTTQWGLSTQFSEGAEVISAMSAQADETWLMSDSSKFGQAGFVRVLGLDDLAGIITDRNLAASDREVLAGQARLSVRLV